MPALPGEPLLSPKTMATALTARAGVLPPGLELFAYGREALKAYLQRQPNLGTLLAPSYICTEATEPLADGSVRVGYYPVSETLAPDWAWLEGQEPGRHALLLVHYFGFANALAEAQELCARRGWLLVEDCAHSFLTQHEGGPIGAFGDAGVYSYRKMLPLPDGAGLLVRQGNEAAAPRDPAGEPAPVPYRAVGRQLLKYLLYRGGISPRALRLVRSAEQVVPQPAAAQGAHAMSRLSRRIMAALEDGFARIAATRRENYERLAAGFSGFPEARLPFPALDEGTCPWVFPVLLEERDGVVAALRDQGVPAGTWPELPAAVAREPSFDVAHRYAARLMTLPVHQDLGPAQMDRMLEAYSRVRAGAARSAP